MKRGGYLKCGAVLLFLSAGAQAATGAAILFNLLSTHSSLATFVLEIHEWNGPVLVTLIVIHILLNREWIRSQLLRKAAASSVEVQHR